jgi:hypothetical protein
MWKAPRLPRGVKLPEARRLPTNPSYGRRAIAVLSQHRNTHARPARQATPLFFPECSTQLRTTHRCPEHHPIDEPQGKLLGQCTKGELRHSEKTELVHHREYPDRDTARHELFAYIEGYAIVRGSTPPLDTSPHRGQRQKPHNPVSTFLGEGHARPVRQSRTAA